MQLWTACELVLLFVITGQFGLFAHNKLLTTFDLETVIFFMLQTESVRCEQNVAMTANQKRGHHLILRKVGQICEQLVRNFSNRIGSLNIGGNYLWRPPHWDGGTEDSGRLAARKWLGRSTRASRDCDFRDSRLILTSIPSIAHKKSTSSDCDSAVHPATPCLRQLLPDRNQGSRGNFPSLKTGVAKEKNTSPVSLLGNSPGTRIVGLGVHAFSQEGIVDDVPRCSDRACHLVLRTGSHTLCKMDTSALEGYGRTLHQTPRCRQKIHGRSLHRTENT